MMVFRGGLGFSPREMRGIVALLLALVVLFGILIYLKNSEVKDAVIVKNTEQQQHDKQLNNNLSDSSYNHISTHDKPRKKIELFEFDPNTLPAEKWMLFGLTEKQVAVIDKYRLAGGQFRTKQDVNKLYVVSDELYSKLEPYINIKNTLEATPEVKQTSIIRFYDTLMIDINRADSARFTQLKGIGAAFARRIVKYRDRLGGFYSKSQLLEVYGMDTLRYNGFKNNITISTDNVVKININAVEFKQLVSHPYFEYYIVKSLFNYKNKVGHINSVEELRKAELMTDPIFDKISPYLSVK